MGHGNLTISDCGPRKWRGKGEEKWEGDYRRKKEKRCEIRRGERGERGEDGERQERKRGWERREREEK